jgi:hypothetical protein
MRRRHPVPVCADGITWPSEAEYRQAQKMAVGITGEDIQLIDKLVRHTEQAARRGRPDMVSGSHWDKERRRQDMVRSLCLRAGAGTASGAQVVPLTVAEIEQLKDIRHDIQYFTEYYLLRGHRDPMLDQADDLLNRLHALLGYARATGERGGVMVFRADPGRSGPDEICGQKSPRA